MLLFQGTTVFFCSLQVWKDVDGVLTCDPNIYSGAQPVPYLTFEEAAELAYFGAQVILSIPFNNYQVLPSDEKCMSSCLGSILVDSVMII